MSTNSSINELQCPVYTDSLTSGPHIRLSQVEHLQIDKHIYSPTIFNVPSNGALVEQLTMYCITQMLWTKQQCHDKQRNELWLQQ
jgi:hypothetical protein